MMKKLLMTSAMVFLVSVGNMALANSEPVFWDEAKDLYYYKDGNKVVYLPTGVNGKDGATGATGAQGETGPKGDKGDTGAQGDTGPKGDTGATGAQGETGPKGDKGDTGPKGDKGDTGAQGPKGDTGATGAQGETGNDGNDGNDGTNGTNGTNGRDGRDVDYGRYQSDLATVGALGGLEMRQGGEGVLSWSAGVGITSSGGSSEEAFAVGLHYGISDDLGVYGKLSKSFNGDSLSAFVGLEGQF